ncbi:MAG: TIGR03663 family protein [Verrucomicrobia bacterium]|nr:TIGR03663 family protein [Verrucomicrobiota bacterium]
MQSTLPAEFSVAPPVEPPPAANVPVGVRQEDNAVWWPLACALVLALAAVLRLWQLDLRPPHFDEGVNGMFTDRMVTGGYYKYDPTNYHGPLHFYVLFLFKILFGRSLWALRLPTALISVAAVTLTLRSARFFGRPTAWLAALGLALSPVCVYFGRDAIHESWLLFFLVLTFLGLVGLWRDGRRADLWATALGLTGAVLTKETYVIHVTAFLGAGCFVFLSETLLPSRPPAGQPAAPRWDWRDGLAVAGVCVGLIVLFYTGFFFNPRGLLGIFTTFSSWTHKAIDTEGHYHKWNYWLWLLWQHEPWVLLGLALSLGWAWWQRGSWPLRFIAVYAVGALVAYSVVPYKTPWCLVSIVWPFFFVVAAGLAALARAGGRLGAAGAALVLVPLTGWTGWQMWQVNFKHFADEDEPYSYVQTRVTMRRLTDPLLALARRSPTNYHRKGLVLSNSPHPLPWVLGDFTDVGYYYLPRKPADYDADFLIVAEDRVNEVEAKLRGRYYRFLDIPLRPAMGPMALYLRAEVFAPVMPKDLEPEFNGGEGRVIVGPPQNDAGEPMDNDAPAGEMDDSPEDDSP